MFTIEVDSELTLALIEPSFAKKYFEIVSKEEAYLSQWLACHHTKNLRISFYALCVNR